MQINQADPETIEDHNLGVPQRDDSKRFKCEYCHAMSDNMPSSNVPEMLPPVNVSIGHIPEAYPPLPSAVQKSSKGMQNIILL